MDDSRKTKEQLIEEIAALRQQLATRQTASSRPTHLCDNPADRAAQLSVRSEASQLDPPLNVLQMQHLEQAEAMQNVMIELTRELDLSTLMEMIIERVAQLVNVTTGVVLLWDETHQRLTPKAWIGVEDWIGDVSWTLGQGGVAVAAQRRQALLVDNYLSSPYAISPFTERCTFTSVIAEPLLYRNQLVGVIALTHKHEPHTFTREDQELLRLFATPAAIALENARLFEESKQRQKWLSSILSINQRMASSTHMEALLAQISAEAAQLIGADGAGIRLLRDDHFVAIENSKGRYQIKLSQPT